MVAQNEKNIKNDFKNVKSFQVFVGSNVSLLCIHPFINSPIHSLVHPLILLIHQSIHSSISLSTNSSNRPLIRQSIYPSTWYLCIFSLYVDNFYRGIRELHLWLAPWCSYLLATRLQMLYSLTLCYCTVCSLMFVYMLVYYSPIGAPHYGTEKYFTVREVSLFNT